MLFDKLFVVTLALSVQRCLSDMLIEVNKTDGFAELEEAAIQTVKNCCAGQRKTILLAGHFPRKFIERLSESFSLAFADRTRRAENNIMNLFDIDESHIHKDDMLITIAPDVETFKSLFIASWLTVYDNPSAPILQLVWPPDEMYSGCDGGPETLKFFDWPNIQYHLKTIVMCQHRTKGIIMYSTNPYKNYTPEPWQSHPLQEAPKPNNRYYYFVREYRSHEELCQNLYYDKTLDLGGTAIQKFFAGTDEAAGFPKNGSNDLLSSPFASMLNRLIARHTFKIDSFISYVNGTPDAVWFGKTGRSQYPLGAPLGLWAISFQLRNRLHGKVSYRSNVHGVQCTWTMTQHRGYKSQLGKILSVIDDYSWYGTYAVYFVTWIFFVFFLRQPPFVGILNLFRLTANTGLMREPIGTAPRVYFGCLLFFVVTMQGIFSGDLASLLTHDIPVRQADTMQDLIDMNYTFHLAIDEISLFSDPVFKGRIKVIRGSHGCLSTARRDPSVACVVTGYDMPLFAALYGLHMSECIATDYTQNVIGFRWFLRDRYNRFLSYAMAGDFLKPFSQIVKERRSQMELESERELGPEIMTFNDLSFAFVFLGIGSACAYVVFLCELALHRYHRGAMTRVLPFTLN